MKPVPEFSHQQAADVLPWFVNGTLTGQEHAAVEAHVRNCLSCRSDLEQLQRWQSGLTHALQERPVANSAAAGRAAALIARTRTRDLTTAKHSGRGRHGFAARLLTMLSGLTGPPRAAALATAILLMVGVVTWSLIPRTPATGDFRTLTTPDSLRAGQYVRVVLSPQAESGSIDRLVRDLGLVIAAGPSEHGVYTLTLDNDGWPQVVTALQADPAVLFAETFAVTVDDGIEP